MMRWTPALVPHLALVLGLLAASEGCKRGQEAPAGETQRTPDRQVDQAPPEVATSGEPETGASARPFLWRVVKDGKTSHLFGTMHVGVDASDQVHPAVWRAFADSDQVVLEIVTSQLSMAQTQELLFLPEGKSLRDGLTEEQWSALESNVSGIPDDQLSRISPLMASVLLASQWLPATSPLDQVIEHRARDQKKSVHGLESFEETRAFTQNLAHTKYLAFMLDDLPRARRELKQMHAAYLQGDASAMITLVFSPESMKEFPELYEELFYQRNRAWVPKIEKVLAEGDAFIAVGAGHLLGESSVVALLEDRGYQVQRIPAE